MTIRKQRASVPCDSTCCQVYASCLMTFFVLMGNIILHLVFHLAIRRKDNNPTFLMFVEFVGTTAIYLIPAIFISCVPEGKPRYIYSLICSIFNIIGIILLITGVIGSFVVATKTFDAIAPAMLGFVTGIVLVARLIFTCLCFVSKKGYSDETEQQNEYVDEEVDMRKINNQQNNENNQTSNNNNPNYQTEMTETNTIINDF